MCTAIYSYILGCADLRIEGSGELTSLECNCIFVRERRARQYLEIVEALHRSSTGLSLGFTGSGSAVEKVACPQKLQHTVLVDQLSS